METITSKYYKRMDLTMSDTETMRTVAHALSTQLRLQILRLISEKSMNVVEIATILDVPVSTIAVNVDVLEKANLIQTEQLAGAHGRQKRCTRITDAIAIDLKPPLDNACQTGEIAMPIGAYSRCEGITPSCGLASEHDYIGLQDDPLYFYAPERLSAQIIWFRQGFVEYRFPVMQLRNERLSTLEILFEACSEAIGYDNQCKSDITVMLNEIEIGRWESPGDFGGRRGLLNPDWWPSFSSQFGMLKNWRVTNKGTYLDNLLVSSVTLADLRIQEKNYLSLRIGVSVNATHVGGVNLFGRCFGDSPQDILLRYYIT